MATLAANPIQAIRGSDLPGIALCLAVTVAASIAASLERLVLGAVWLEPLVLSILIGAAVRTCWDPGAAWRPGIAFGAKTLLEIAVILLGLSVDARAMLAIGPALIAGIASIVVLAVAGSYGIGRLCGLPHRMSVLIACGNSICGNSAIAAVAPVIGANGEDIASSIAFTAVFGVGLVLALPLAVPLLHLAPVAYGVLAGMTVYAVPQVLAATAPIGAVAVQIGTTVKLIRVLMLGPVVLVLSLLATDRPAPSRPRLHRLVPAFILGFLALAAARSAGVVPVAVLHPVAHIAAVLTVVSMAALGLGTDLRMVARAGRRVTTVVLLSLLLLGGMSFILLTLL